MVYLGAEITGLYTQLGFPEKSIREQKRLLPKAIKIKDEMAIGQILGQDIINYNKLEDYENMDKQLNKLVEFNKRCKTRRFEGVLSSFYYNL